MGDQTTHVPQEPVATRVLVVDDDQAIRQVLAAFLRRHQVEVIEAADGAEALDLIRAQAVNLVISDMMMPKLNGLELLAAVRERQPTVPVIIITGMPAVEAAVECMRIGAFDYLGKPFKFDRLRELVTRGLRENQRLRAEQSTARFPILNPGRFFRNYQITRLLGEGSVGIVFLVRRQEELATALATPSDRFAPGDGAAHHSAAIPAGEYALKLLKPQFLTEDKRGIIAERFLREAMAASTIHHPGVVKVVEYGLTSDEKLPFIVMEYLVGKPLKYYTDHPTALSPREKVEILRQIAEALAAIHAQGICHRDIKPHNILINDAGQAKVMDFGIARLPDSELTMTSELLGSPAYLAPESFLSAHVDHRGDLFSLGIVAYELLLGEKPFKGANLSNFAHLIQHERPVEPRKLQPGFPWRLQALLAHLLKKKREERIASATLVSQELAVFLAEGDLSPTLVGSIARAFAGDWR